MMHPAETFELVLGMLVASLLPYLLAERLFRPPSAMLLVGDGAIAFLPAMPPVMLDPELVLVQVLPPLLMGGPSYRSAA